jgi:integrase
MARAGRKDRGLFSKKDAAGRLRWFVRLWHEGKPRQFGSFNSKTEAREFYEKAKQEQKLGQFFPERYQQSGFAKLEQVLDEYLAGFTGKTKREEIRFGRKWNSLYPRAGLNALTPAALEKARALLTEEGRTPQTVNRYMAFLRRVLNKAVRDGKIANNPVSRLKMVREYAGKTRFLSPDEENRLCDALGPDYAVWVRIALLTGMRQLEQFSLRWTDVDLTRGLITLPETKAGGVQYVRLNDEASLIFRALHEQALKAQAIAEAEAIAQLRVGGRTRPEWVFPSKNPTTHVDPRNFYRRVYVPKVIALGLEGVTWHTLRHTFASRLAMSGATEGTIAALLRHSGTSLVKRYAHLSPSHLQQEIEKLSSFGKGTPPAKVQLDRPKADLVTGKEGEMDDEQDDSGTAGSFPTVSETVTYPRVTPC